MAHGGTYGNPAVIGLAGFGLTTLLLQLHNLELIGLGPVVAMGLVFGGLAQFLAGIMEFKVGNNFGMCSFTSYGAFWLGFVVMLFLKGTAFECSHSDIAWFLIIYGLYTVIMLIVALRIHKAMVITLSLLLVGIILLVLELFAFPALKSIAAIVLITCALSAWYMLIGILLNDVAQKDIIPMGKKII